MHLPDVAGLTVFDAALVYVNHQVPVVPFDPTRGKGKSCWNLFSYHQVTLDETQLIAWRDHVGEFAALATCPGAFGHLVIDVDQPRQFPPAWRDYLDDATVPYVATRPTESQRRGHYWFALPPRLASGLGNPAFDWGEVRCVGGGIVLPPHGDRRVVRSGVPPLLPDELHDELSTRALKAGAGESVSVQQFSDQHRDNDRPHKLAALLRMHDSMLNRGRSPHDAMRAALRVGLSEARIGYMPAGKVIAALREQWPTNRRIDEFDSLIRWAVKVAMDSDPESIQRVSDRPLGTDTRTREGAQ